MVGILDADAWRAWPSRIDCDRALRGVWGDGRRIGTRPTAETSQAPDADRIRIDRRRDDMGAGHAADAVARPLRFSRRVVVGHGANRSRRGLRRADGLRL